MRKWLAETHGPTFELLRHFLARFFDSDLVTSPGQTAAALIGSSTMFLTWFPFFTGPIKDKYARLTALGSPRAYRTALRADELWLIVMMMSAIGLLTAIQWQRLFPSLADYRAIGWMPVRTRQIFGAKLAALLIVASGAALVLNLPPALGFPMLSGSSVRATLAALIAASYFIFFALVAIRGALLNLRTAGSVQSVLAAALVIALVLSFSIGPQFARAVTRPEIARWFPPVWFLGFCQAMAGDPDPAMHALARRAMMALAAAIALALAAFAVSYRRHRKLTMEGAPAGRRERRWRGALFDWLAPNPREQAVVVFLARGFAGNGPHRMILMGYAGFGLAVLASGAIGMMGLVDREHAMAARFVYAHVVLLAFLLIGLRHLFAIPLELKANWMFQLTEREGRRAWMGAMDCVALTGGVAALVAMPFPLEARLLGWRAVGEVLLFAAFALASYEAAFASWDKLPFTCSYLPGKRPMWMLALRLFALLAALPLVNALLVECLYNRVLFLVLFGLLMGIRWRARRSRRQGWTEMRLKYEEAPDAAIEGLKLLR